ncbi:unnamed protein product [Phytophthora lilii]|uniref:Unnamed protein product n=1 Tax=Phytophthora lilii TaxID=2077276 RepID=A0A9W6YKN2_9STRA|nr:unnamed protein product [Phytophthora lilii]
MLGNMDLSGMIVKPIASIFSAGVHFGVTRLLDLAEVRRLTDMTSDRRQYREVLLSDAVDQSISQSSSAATFVDREGCTVCKRGKPSKLVECHLCGQGVCPRCRSTKRVWVSDRLGIMGWFRKIQACSKCVMRANTGTYEPPVERVRSQRSHQSGVSTNPSDGDPSSKSSVGSLASPAFDGVLYEDIETTRRQSPQVKVAHRRRTKTPSTPEVPVVGRSFVHQGASTYPDAAEIAVPCTSPEYEVPKRLRLHEPRSYPGKSKLSIVEDPGYSRSVGSIPAETKPSKMRT